MDGNILTFDIGGGGGGVVKSLLSGELRVLVRSDQIVLRITFCLAS